MADVAKHNTQQDCWAAVDGDVYDLTSWISRHPGGADKIIPLCGTDASAAFRNQHGSQERPKPAARQFPHRHARRLTAWPRWADWSHEFAQPRRPCQRAGGAEPPAS